MKELVQGIIAFLGATLVTALITIPGWLFALIYCLHGAVRLKRPQLIFKFIFKLIDGNLASLGYILKHIALSQDMSWNVNAGQLLEYFVAKKKQNTLGDKNITVSASVGDLELQKGGLTRIGFGFSRALNIVFNQKRHAVDAWLYREAEGKLRAQYFHKLRERVKNRDNAGEIE